MQKHKESLRYGFELYPYSVLVAVGLLVSGTGPALLRSAAGSLAGGSTAVMLAGTLVFQVLGAVIGLAGLFGGLHRLMSDTVE